MRKFGYILLSGMLSILNTYAQDFENAMYLDGQGGGNGRDIVTDSNHDVIAVGAFWSTADFDPGPSMFTLSSNGNSDAYVAKYDSSLNLIWAFSISGALGVDARSVTVDSNNNIYVTGEFSGMVDFDPTTNNSWLTANGNEIFVAKYNQNGQLQWAFKISNTQLHPWHEIESDPTGNIYLIGMFDGLANFDPRGTGFNKLASGSDIFVASYDSGGYLRWVFDLDPASNGSGGRCTGLSLDNNGHFVISGYFSLALEFSTPQGILTLTAPSNQSGFIAKYDTAGTFQWVRQTAGGYAQPYAVAIDDSNNIYFAGRFGGQVDFDLTPTSSLYNITGPSGQGFLSKFSPTGTHINTVATQKPLGQYPSVIDIRNIKVNENGDVFATGNFGEVIDLDPSSNTAVIASTNGQDCFVARYNSNLDHISSFNIGPGENERGEQVHLDDFGNLYLIGQFQLQCDFDPSPASFSFTISSGSTMFLAKYSQCSGVSGLPILSATSTELCVGEMTTLQVDSGSLNDANHWSWYSGGCGGTLVGTGDSIQIAPTSPTTYFVRGEGSCVTSGNCESINVQVHPHYQIQDTVLLCEGDSIYAGGGFQSTGGTYSDSLFSQIGCDSTITTTLEIVSVDTSSYSIGTTIIANAANASYQWFDCATGVPISSQNGPSFTPVTSGTYGVEILQNGCLDTSRCHTILVVGNDQSKLGGITIGPNPTPGPLRINLTETPIWVKVRVYSLHGKLVKQASTENSSDIDLDLSRLSKGLYSLTIHSDLGVGTFKILRQ